MKHVIRWLPPLGIAAVMAIIRGSPGFSALWQAHISLPVLELMHRATAPLPFPLLEPLALAALLLCARRHPAARLRRLVWIAAAIFALLWYPAYWVRPAIEITPANASSLEALCLWLIDTADDVPARIEDWEDRAGEVSGMPGAVVKRARYPEWMRGLGIAGLFSPWTGEAIIDSALEPELQPFTCVHELMHLRGIADEGAANIAAYRACAARGGAFAHSARLWALRYATARLHAVDPVACSRITSQMSEPMKALCASNTSIQPPHPLMRLFGLAAPSSDYADLADWLAAQASTIDIAAE